MGWIRLILFHTLFLSYHDHVTRPSGDERNEMSAMTGGEARSVSESLNGSLVVWNGLDVRCCISLLCVVFEQTESS